MDTRIVRATRLSLVECLMIDAGLMAALGVTAATAFALAWLTLKATGLI